MENEEIGGLINKKDSEDQLAGFVNVSSWSTKVWNSLIILSLSLTLLVTLSFLGALWFGAKERESKEGKARSSSLNMNTCK